MTDHKKRAARHKLESLETVLSIPHDVTQTDEDRLIHVVDRIQQVLEHITAVLGMEIQLSPTTLMINAGESKRLPYDAKID